MAETIRIGEFFPGEEKEVYDLVMRVFNEFVGHEYSAQGNAVFNEFAAADNIARRFEEGNIIQTAKIEYQGKTKIIGMIEARDYNHICLLFVDTPYQGRKVARQLFETLRARVQQHTDFIEVNSSPYAVGVYESLGFTQTGQLTQTDGITYVPMRMGISSRR